MRSDTGFGVSFWGNENMLESNSYDGYTTLQYSKTTEPHALKGVNLMVCELYLIKTSRKIKEIILFGAKAQHVFH